MMNGFSTNKLSKASASNGNGLSLRTSIRRFFRPFRGMRASMLQLRAIPHFLANLRKYRSSNRRPSFEVSLRNTWFRSFDRYENAGQPPTHYFLQDLWAAKKLRSAAIAEHVDVGSRVDGFVSHILIFSRVTYVDVRPLDIQWEGLEFRRGLITELPFPDESIASLSSLHVIEHVGLGRYGDPIEPEGPWFAAQELMRVLSPQGRLLIGVPTGRERLCFDAHRVFAPETIIEMFRGLRLAEFSFINDSGRFIRNADLREARDALYGCGLFEFIKPAAQATQ